MKRLSLIIILTMVLAVCGCSGKSGKKYFWQKNNQVKTIGIISSPDANGNSPTAVDLIFIYNDFLGSELLKLNADQWFETKNEVLLKFYGGVDVLSYEVVPFSEVKDIKLPDKHKDAVDIIIFAQYQSAAGSIPSVLTNYKYPLIRLEKEKYTIRSEV